MSTFFKTRARFFRMNLKIDTKLSRSFGSLIAISRM
jgi:hypothetical protein